MSNEAEFVVERVTVQPGRTFSPEALDSLGQEMTAFVATQVWERWQQTNEPPTRLVVHVRVEAA